MQIDKNQILDLLREQGRSDQVDRADAELPQQVDTDQHADLLSKFGLDIPSVLGKVTGGQGGLGGLLGG